MAASRGGEVEHLHRVLRIDGLVGFGALRGTLFAGSSLTITAVSMQEIIHADAAQHVATLRTGSIRLAYVDPPFRTGTTRRSRERRTGRESAFDDRWATIGEYVRWLRSILEPTVTALSQDGCLFLHCDWRTSHHVRVLLDDLMGEENFRNEIIWHYRRWTAATGSLQRLHQTIFYYARTPAHSPNVPMVDYSPTTNLDQIWQSRGRNSLNVSVYAGVEGELRNAGAKRGVPLGDVWEIPPLNPKARERVGYPTQKPLALLERILAIGSQPGDWVLDPCCGSGTTIVAAKLLDRNGIGIDCSARAVELSEARLADPIKSASKVINGRAAFERRWLTPEYTEALELLAAHPVQRNQRIHGYLSPDGLRNLGLPPEWSVPVALIDGATHDVAHWTAALASLAQKKRSHAALALTNVGGGESHERVVTGPWPTNAADVVEIRKRVEQWLMAQHPESA